MLNKFWILFFYLILCSIIQSPVYSNQHHHIKSKLDRLFSPKSGLKGIWGCCISNIQTQEIVYSLNPDTSLIPASNQKLVTLAAALLKLSKYYRSHTVFWADGPITNNILHGNLIIKGFGAIYFTGRYPHDLSIEEKNFKLAQQVKQLIRKLNDAGISEIDGNIIIDWSEWTDMSKNHHYPAAAPVLFNENTIDIGVHNKSLFSCPPLTKGFNLIDHNWNGKQKRTPSQQYPDKIFINRRINSIDYWRLEQTPALLFYYWQIKHQLESHGIPVHCNPQKVKPRQRVKYQLFELNSLSLEELVKYTGLYSDNLRAEIIFLNLGYILAGKANYDTAGNAVISILSEHLPTIDSVSVRDGSGLSRRNRISPLQLVRILNLMTERPQRDTFLSSLPVAGKSGTLRKRYLNSKINGLLIGKTGTLNGVTALSGYLLQHNKPKYSFSFINNNNPNHSDAWALLEKMGDILAEMVK